MTVQFLNDIYDGELTFDSTATGEQDREVVRGAFPDLADTSTEAVLLTTVDLMRRGIGTQARCSQVNTAITLEQTGQRLVMRIVRR
jgi:hypothetical protein